MYVIEVIPLTPLPPNVPQILSYFFDKEVVKGALVEAPIGSRKIPAIVISCASLENQKIALKKTGFQLKKLSKIIDPQLVANELQLKMTAWLSRHYYASLGMCMKTVLPPFIGKKGYYPPKPFSAKEGSSDKPRMIAVRADITLDTIRKVIKKSNGQVLILAPEMGTAAYYQSQIPESALLTSNSTVKEYRAIWKGAIDGTIRIICATRVGLFLPFPDLETIIMDDPHHEAYKSDMTPRYNAVDVARKLTELTGAKLIMLTPQPSMEDQYDITQSTLTFEDRRSKTRPTIELMNMVPEIRTGNFSLFAKSFQDAIIHALTSNQRILLFSSRRAYAGVLMCGNCDLVFQCKNCHIPLRPHKTSETLLVCYHCSAYHSAPTQCPNCASAKLRTSGMAGSQKIKEEIDLLLAQYNLPVTSYILDSDLILKDEDEDTLMKEYAAWPDAILIATHMVFSHRHTQKFDLIGIPTTDGLITAPDFRNEDRSLYYMEKLLDFDPQRIILQTYHPESPIYTALKSRDYPPFYERELVARKILGYPPFSRLVRLTFRHRDQKKASFAARTLGQKLTMAIQQLKLGDHIGISGPSPTTFARDNAVFSYGILLKIAPTVERLDTILKYVPNGWIIDVDPSSAT